MSTEDSIAVGGLPANRGSMATVTKRDMVVELSNKTGLRQQDVFSVVDGLIDVLSNSLAEGHDVTLRGFGTFELRVAKSKIGRNPNQPGSEVTIPARCVVRLRPGKELKARVAAIDPSKITA